MDNSATIQYLNDSFNAKKFDQFYQIFSPNVINHVSAQVTQVGVDALIATFEPWLEAMPDLHSEINAMAEQDGKVAVRNTYTGTHLGTFMRVAPATGKHITWTSLVIYRFDQSGKIIERWQDLENYGLSMQLGFVPPAARTAKDVVQHVYEDAWGRGLLHLIDELVGEHYTDHSAPPGSPGGREGFRQMVTMYRAAFPDIRIDAEQIVQEGDKFAVRLTMQGTHRGPFLGIAPTNRQVTFGGMAFVRVRDGKIAERWGLYDMGGLMGQLTQAGKDTDVE